MGLNGLSLQNESNRTLSFEPKSQAKVFGRTNRHSGETELAALHQMPNHRTARPDRSMGETLVQWSVRISFWSPNSFCLTFWFFKATSKEHLKATNLHSISRETTWASTGAAAKINLEKSRRRFGSGSSVGISFCFWSRFWGLKSFLGAR